MDGVDWSERAGLLPLPPLWSSLLRGSGLAGRDGWREWLGVVLSDANRVGSREDDVDVARREPVER